MGKSLATNDSEMGKVGWHAIKNFIRAFVVKGFCGESVNEISGCEETISPEMNGEVCLKS